MMLDWLVTLRAADPSSLFPVPGKMLADLLGERLKVELVVDDGGLLGRVTVPAESAVKAEWAVVGLLESQGAFGLARIVATMALDSLTALESETGVSGGELVTPLPAVIGIEPSETIPPPPATPRPPQHPGDDHVLSVGSQRRSRSDVTPPRR